MPSQFFFVILHHYLTDNAYYTNKTFNTTTMIWHFLALLTACIWGTTFVASKVLLNAGLTPAEIMCLRFIIAWVLMLPWCHAKLKTSPSEELLFMALGMSGGSMYFLTENTAVQLTSSTSTVALLVCTTPIITALMNRCIHRNEHLSNRFLMGSILALAGVSLVVFNGVFVLDDNPLVIILAIGAAVCWSIYSLIIRKVESRYSSAIITRKVFFWGVVTMLPVCLTHQTDWSVFQQPTAVAWLLFLAVVASLGCFLAWNVVLSRINVIVANNYLYLNPVTSLIVAYIVLSERITWLAIIGCLFTIAGVYLCNKQRKGH